MIKIIEDWKDGYISRTVQNAASCDVTLAFAVNFYTKGELLTKKSCKNAGKRYIPIKLEEVTIEGAKILAEKLNSFERDIAINIAGNGIYSLMKNQEYYDTLIYEFLLLTIYYMKYKIINIRTGGQTGIDESGAKAGSRLEIDTTVLCPKGFTFRNKQGIDINSEEMFKNRFLLIKK